MANIKDLKKKIRSTKSTLKITTAMKLVSAAKLNKAQQALVNARPYGREIEDSIKTISALVDNYKHAYLQEQENKMATLLVVSSDRGLCGGYNSQLAKEVKKFLAQSSFDFQVYFIGKKGRDILKKQANEKKTFAFKKSAATFLEIKAIAEELGFGHQSGEVGQVYLAYNFFRSTISFVPTIKKVLPMSLDEDLKKKLKSEYPFDFQYDPSPKEILDTLIPSAFENIVYNCVLNANAAEHGARMSAMDNASKNCKELIRTLTLKMNKLRQAAITTELIEVVSGAESLKS